MASDNALSGYRVGEISQFLCGRQARKARKEQNEELSALFSSAEAVQPEFVLVAPNVAKKTSKKSSGTKSNLQDTERRKLTTDNAEEDLPTLQLKRKRKLVTSNEEDNNVIQKKQRKVSKASRESKDDPERLARTVFVGNLPVAFTRKKLKQLFAIYGSVESVRFRSAGLAKPDLSRRIAMKKQEFDPDRHNINGYVVFKDKECAEQALQSNGLGVDGLHIRVDLAANDHHHDHSRSVFIGNLPFDVEEEPLRQAFSDCGKIEAVRIVRDNKTGVGKGFGFVLFKDKDAVMFALKMNKKEFSGRKLRVFPSSKNPNSGQTREVKKGRPVAYSFSGLTAKRNDQSRSNQRKKKQEQGHGKKQPSNSTHNNKNRNKQKTFVKNDFKNGGKKKTKRKQRS